MVARILLSLTLAAPCTAETVVAARTVRPQSVLTAADLTLQDGTMPGSFPSVAALIGKETRVVLYAGRPVLPEDIAAPAIVDRNQIVTLTFARDGLTIRTEGRALGRAGVGDSVRVMNLQSRTTLSGRVQADGSVMVQ